MCSVKYLTDNSSLKKISYFEKLCFPFPTWAIKRQSAFKKQDNFVVLENSKENKMSNIELK